MHGSVQAVVLGGLDDLRNAVGPGQGRFIFAGRGVAALDGRGDHLAFDGERTVLADGPAGDVVVMRAPVGDRAARVLPPPAEVAVAALPQILRPPAPVRARSPNSNPAGTCCAVLERPRPQTRRHPDGDGFQLADALVAHQFAGQTEIAVASLLRSGLEHHLVVPHRLDDPLSFRRRSGSAVFPHKCPSSPGLPPH